jgi:3-oxoacyl-[acyl-carrier-protein] synthase-1
MSQSNRVFVTGLGAVTACGATVDANWEALLAGETAISEITAHDLSTWDYRLGGELKNYQPGKNLPDRKLVKVISRHDAMGIQAAVQAVEDSQCIDYRDTLSSPESFNEDTAVYVGSPGNKYSQQYDFLPLMAKTNSQLPAFAEHLFSEVHPTWLLRILPNNVLAYTGITYGFKGENHNIVNHAASGMQAILEAYHAIRSGLASRAVVVAYDMGTEPQALFYYERLGVLSARHLRPFDASHDGTILAEGAAALVLESEASLLSRGRTPYAEILGGRTETEGNGLFAMDPQGTPLAAMLQRTLDDQQLQASDLGLIVAHGNGNPTSDISEARAIESLLGTHTAPVTAFKWAMGHTLCASGVLDAVLATEALRRKSIPGLANLEALAPDCHALNISKETRAWTGEQHALIINRGFAGMNVSLVMKACD